MRGEIGYQHVGIIIKLYQPGNSRISGQPCNLNDMPALAEINFTTVMASPWKNWVIVFISLCVPSRAFEDSTCLDFGPDGLPP